MGKRRKKTKRKRWYKARLKAQRKARFVTGFRNHFVKKGILKGGGDNV